MPQHRKSYKISQMVLLRLGELEISVRDVLRQAELPRGLLHDDRTAFDIGQYFAFWRAIEAVAGSPMIGFQIAAIDKQDQIRSTIQKYLALSRAIANLADDPIFEVQMDSIVAPKGPELLMLATLVSRNYRDGLERLARYKRLIHAAEQLELIESEGVVRARFVWRAPRKLSMPDVLVDMEFAFLLHFGSFGIGSQVKPLAVHLRRQHLASRSDYEAFFDCPIKTGTDFNEIHFSSETLARPFQTYSSEALELFDPQLQKKLAEIEAQQKTATRVKEVLIELISARRPTVEDVAQELAISKRTLQRKLRQEGTSFNEVLAKTRKELALFYLKKSGVEVAEVAFLLGFEDVSSFYRAFQSWTGHTPKHYRLAA